MFVVTVLHNEGFQKLRVLAIYWTSLKKAGLGNRCFLKFFFLTSKARKVLHIKYEEFDFVFQIQCSELEKEIQSVTEETELFYNRGV